MLSSMRWLTPVGLVLLGWLIAADPAAAQKNKPVPLKGVKDAAGLFSDDAIERARREIKRIKQDTGKDLVVETLDAPTGRYKKLHEEGKEFAKAWAESNFEDLGVNGVYVLILKTPPKLQATVGNKTRQLGSFTTTERNALVSKMIAKLKEAFDAPDAKKAQALRDEALLAGVDYARGHMTAPARVVGGAPPREGNKAAMPSRPRSENPGGLSILHWILIGLAVVLGLWLIIGIFRALTGAGRASPGYGGGGGGYGGGGGGGGGGFFSSLMGGLFGAAAGMWLYHNVFGGGTPSAGASGGDYGGGDASPTDTSGDAAGGDYGGGAGADAGGDAGAGGDWGGGGGGNDGKGGDAGGGGDWGGGGDAGGGDAGGGGGGDWGGGGGGGGGGDWGGGGGGGGGDW